MPKQSINSVLMIRPASFGYNAETGETNSFSHAIGENEKAVQTQVLHEFDNMAEKLRLAGIHVVVIEDTPEPPKPDAIFPNNWITFHEDRTAFIYPMRHNSRRLEKRPEILEQLKATHHLGQIHDLTPLEEQDEFLEGTGSMVLDRINRIAYACLSPRTTVNALAVFAEKAGYSTVIFHAEDGQGKPIYHTNVVMWIGTKVAAICWEAIPDWSERKMLQESLDKANKPVINLSLQQMLDGYAGNMLEVVNNQGQLCLVMSATANTSLTPNQKLDLSGYFYDFIVCDIPKIEEVGGGSARCMLAEIFLPPR